MALRKHYIFFQSGSARTRFGSLRAPSPPNWLGREHFLPLFLARHCLQRFEYRSPDFTVCHVLTALSCYRLSHRDSTFVNWIAEQHLHVRCGVRDRTCVGPRRVGGLPGPVRAER